MNIHDGTECNYWLFLMGLNVVTMGLSAIFRLFYGTECNYYGTECNYYGTECNFIFIDAYKYL